MLDYDAYRDALPYGALPRDRDRHVLTSRLTRLLMSQNLTLSMFLFYSPSDTDAYLRPKVSYRLSDAWRVEVGANLFIGQSDHTFFGQFEENSNLYGAIRRFF